MTPTFTRTSPFPVSAGWTRDLLEHFDGRETDREIKQTEAYRLHPGMVLLREGEAQAFTVYTRVGADWYSVVDVHESDPVITGLRSTT